MTVTVYVWRFNVLGLFGHGNVGHCSIKIAGHDRNGVPRTEYFSWWPGGEAADFTGRRLAHTKSHTINIAYGNKGRSAQAKALENKLAPHDLDTETDKEAEGRSADAKYRFNLKDRMILDESAMLDTCTSLRCGSQVVTSQGHAKGGQYSLVHQNCSDVVAFILEQGGAGDYVPKPRMRFYWTPTDVARWCDQLVRVIERKHNESAERIRGFTGNALDFTRHNWQYSALATSS